MTTTPIPELPIVAYGRTTNASGDEPLCKLSDAIATIEAATEQGKSQPLTAGMIGEMSYYCGDVRGVRIDQFKFARAIEAAHGITAPPQGKI